MAEETSTATATVEKPVKGKGKAKVAKAKDATKARRGAKFSGDAKITLLRKDNPKRPGTATHGRYKFYKTGMTVSQFIAAGGKSVDLPWDQERGFISIKSA